MRISDWSSDVLFRSLAEVGDVVRALPLARFDATVYLDREHVQGHHRQQSKGRAGKAHPEFRLVRGLSPGVRARYRCLAAAPTGTSHANLSRVCGIHSAGSPPKRSEEHTSELQSRK